MSFLSGDGVMLSSESLFCVQVQMFMVFGAGGVPKYKKRVTLPLQIKFRLNYLFAWTRCVLVHREDNLPIWMRVRGVQSFGRAVGGRKGMMGGSPGEGQGP